ncbi:hypothetical protein LEM8419_02111 [Neolewinella maritima]|uniref:Peptidase M56 domain-containing protein n=1 Tax=Neolewinella maritima TaxID=1383882 RepID=A0ABM9B1L0_9BACT|nr:M56 family metallopeptidase [Neolewinella maritima]CAH1001212.1 hypothetical protein LEM8419_02111 [Neolewinella maritima]
MTELIPYDWGVAIARALLHTLWVFALLTGLAHACCSVSRSAAVRYRIYLICLVSLPLAFAALTWWFMPLADTGLPVALPESDFPQAIPDEEVPTVPPVPWPVYLTIGYLVGLVAFGLRTAYHYVRGRSLRRSGLPPPPQARRQFRVLRESLSKTVDASWRISRRISTVVAIGFLHPIILFPIGLLNQLTPQETEAILLHELAHLMRNDHRWVVLQQLVGDLFFYHPLVYWLGRQLEREREFACDDIVRQRVARGVYASALLRVARYTQSIHQPSNPLAVNAIHSLAQRLHRLFTPAQTSGRSWPYPYPSVALLVGLFVLLTGTLSWAQTNTTTVAEEQSSVQGRVLDAVTLQPLIGVTVRNEATSAGTITDFEGRYALILTPGEHQVEIAYVGYPTRKTTLTVAGTTQLDVLLDKEGGNIPEGASTTSTVIRTGEGNPKRLRSGNILYIVDGKRFEGDPTDQLDPGDIERVDVHKDPETIASVGYGGGFEGAIIITLKKRE